MSAQLDSLLDAERLAACRAADPAYIAPTVAEEDRAASARYVPMDPRVAELQVTLAETRTKLDAALETIADKDRTMSGMARLIGEQRDELRELRGEKLRAQPGCALIRLPIPGSGGAYVIVEAAVDPEEWMGLVSVFVGGRLVDPLDLIDALKNETLLFDTIKSASAESLALSQEP